jgi:hypothetical protein
MDDRKLHRQRAALLAMFAITILPFGLASLFYEHLQGNSSWPTSNNGRMLKPPGDIARLHLQTVAGPELTNHKWRLLLFRPAQCAAECRIAERNLRALPLLFGRDAPRVEIALLNAPDSGTAALDGADRITRVRTAEHIAGVADTGLVVVDPLGNIVLWYSYQQVDKPLLEDMRHLLRVSQFG